MPHRTLSNEDIQKIVEALAKLEDFDDTRGFRLDARSHYNSHARLDRLLDSYDSATSIIVKFFIGVLLVGIITAGAIGAGVHK